MYEINKRKGREGSKEGREGSRRVEGGSGKVESVKKGINEPDSMNSWNYRFC